MCGRAPQAGNWPQVLWMNSKQSQPLSHLSSPCRRLFRTKFSKAKDEVGEKRGATQGFSADTCTPEPVSGNCGSRKSRAIQCDKNTLKIANSGKACSPQACSTGNTRGRSPLEERAVRKKNLQGLSIQQKRRYTSMEPSSSEVCYVSNTAVWS